MITVLLFTPPALTCREAAGWEVYALLVGNSRVNHWPREQLLKIK
jgi:hypothetical protein